MDPRSSPTTLCCRCFSAVPVGVGGWLTGGTGEWLGAKLALAAMAGVLAGLTMVVAMRRLGVSPLVAMLTALVAGLSPPLAIYGTQVYPELPAALARAAGRVLVADRPAVRAAPWPAWWWPPWCCPGCR